MVEVESSSFSRRSSLLPPSPLPSPSSSSSYAFFLRVISKRRTWVSFFIAAHVSLVFILWNLENSIFSWYRSAQESSSSSLSSSSLSSWWITLEASVLLGAGFGVLTTAAALAVAVPAILVAWITVVVFLAMSGMSKKALLIEGRKISQEIVWSVCRVLLKEGNLLAVGCAVLGYFALFK